MFSIKNGNHFNRSIATCSWWLLHGTVQIDRTFPLPQKVLLDTVGIESAMPRNTRLRETATGAELEVLSFF